MAGAGPGSRNHCFPAFLMAKAACILSDSKEMIYLFVFYAEFCPKIGVRFSDCALIFRRVAIAQSVTRATHRANRVLFFTPVDRFA